MSHDALWTKLDAIQDRTLKDNMRLPLTRCLSAKTPADFEPAFRAVLKIIRPDLLSHDAAAACMQFSKAFIDYTIERRAELQAQQQAGTQPS